MQILTITQVYAPTSGSDERDHTEFYETLQSRLLAEKEYFNNLMGVWNAKIGINKDFLKNFEPFGLGEVNEIGERLKEFVISNNLKIADTNFKINNRRWTWLSSDNKIKNEIDHLITDHK